jgi:uncharacterized coiled-coil protein SlyX
MKPKKKETVRLTLDTSEQRTRIALAQELIAMAQRLIGGEPSKQADQTTEMRPPQYDCGGGIY